MKTYSECTRAMIDQAEAEYRAANNDIVQFVMANYVDTIRPQYPATRIFEYNLYRLATPATAAEWDAFAGAGAEAGYIHHAGVRRALPGSGLGWYVMNMGHQPYVDWQHANTVKLANGTRYGAPLFSPPPIAGVLMDLTLWYPEFDDDPAQPLATDPTPNIIGGDPVTGTPSDEYAGTGDLYQTHCKNAYLGMQAALDAAYGVGVVRAYPNFGNLFYAGDGDANPQAIIAASPIILVEEALRYTSGKPNLNSTTCVSRWALIDSILNAGKELWLDGHLVSPQDQAAKDRAKIGVAAFMLLGHKVGMAARFYIDPEDDPDPISTWEQNEYLRLSHNILGNATTERVEVIGGWVQGALYEREFLNGRVYFYPQKTGQSGSDNATVTLPGPMFPLQADNTYGTPITTVDLSVGEGVVLVHTIDVIEYDGTIDALAEVSAAISEPELLAPIGDAHVDGSILSVEEIPSAIDAITVITPGNPPKDKPLPEG